MLFRLKMTIERIWNFDKLL